MTSFFPFPGAAAALALAALAGCASARTYTRFEELSAQPSLTRELSQPSEAEAALAKELRLETVLQVALAQNPELAEVRSKLRAAVAQGRSAGRLPDLELMYQQWGVPLGEPWALGRADSLMIGLRQGLPAPGVLDARARAALEQAAARAEQVRSRVLEVSSKVKHAYYEYYRADREFDTHLEHAALTQEIIELARANYRAGAGGQEQILRAMVELTRVHNALHTLEAQRRSARALLNALMAREPEAPLGPVAEPIPFERQLEAAALEEKLLASRPELRAAEQMVKSGEASLEAAQKGARWPSFMVGVDYMPMPSRGEHAYLAVASMTLPWLNPRHDDEVKEAEHSVAAEAAARDSVRNNSRYELRAALARYDGARRSFELVDKQLVPQARQSFEASRASFAAAKSDALGVLFALSEYLEVRLERFRALAQLLSSLADVERAVGTELENLKGAASHE